jgi:diguanylate cyclase (GGDEF)-like protein
MGHPHTTGHYAGHDPVVTARFAGLIWLIYGGAVLAVLPVAANGRLMALVVGAVVGLTAVAGGAAMVRSWVPRYRLLLACSYAAVVSLAVLQLLFGPVRGDLVVELYLGIALGTASVHPPKRTAGVLVAIAAASVLHEARGGWTSIGATDLVMHAGVWLMVALISSKLVGQLRKQRAVANSEHAEALRLATTDVLTGIGNRRRLLADLDTALTTRSPTVLALFDLDGFKAYNDSFGHPAGDALLRKLAANLSAAVDGRGAAYRMGGDEFCILASGGAEAVVRDAAAALNDRGEAFTIGVSSGSIAIPAEASTSEDALRGADRRMYAQKASGRTSAGRQTTDVLLGVLRERNPDLGDHVQDVTDLCREVAARLGLDADDVSTLLQAAALHDVGKAAIPDAILNKPGPLDEGERALMRQHTVMGQRIMSTAPSLNRASQLVRSSHERIDGTGYPDGLSGDAIPLGSRVIAVCDAFDAMTSDRPYRQALPADAALDELRLYAGTQFDDTIVEALAFVVGENAGPHEASVHEALVCA